MSHTTIAFFNSKGGVGKTSLVYHLAWMYRELGLSVLAADFDPQANLTSAFLDDGRLEELWPDRGHARTVFGALEPLLRGVGAVALTHVEQLEDGLHLIPGDLALSSFEDELNRQWPACLDGQERAFRVISAFWRIIQAAAAQTAADLVLIDLGPNLGAINRATLIATDYVVVPLAPDLFSLQGLRNLGPTLRRWRQEWNERLSKNPDPEELDLPPGSLALAGYVILQRAVRLDRPVRGYARWIERIPEVYQTAVLGGEAKHVAPIPDDPHCLDLVKDYRSLMPLAQEAKKPMFLLRPADGAIGAHGEAVLAAYRDFERLARQIAQRTSVRVPERV